MTLKSTSLLLALIMACGWLPTTLLAQNSTTLGTHPCGLHDAHAELFALRPGSRGAALEAEECRARGSHGASETSFIVSIMALELQLVLAADYGWKL